MEGEETAKKGKVVPVSETKEVTEKWECGWQKQRKVLSTQKFDLSHHQLADRKECP